MASRRSYDVERFITNMTGRRTRTPVFPDDFDVFKLLHCHLTSSARTVIQAHADYWNDNNFQILDEQFGNIRRSITADIIVAAAWIETAFAEEILGHQGRAAVHLMASTSMICLAFIRLSLKFIPKTKRMESCTMEPEGNSAEMREESSQDPKNPPQWELSYVTDLCRKEMYSETKFNNMVITSAFLRNVLQRLAIFCRDQERVLMKEWFGDQVDESKTSNKDLGKLVLPGGVEGEKSSETEDYRDIIEEWIDKSLKILKFNDIPPPSTLRDDMGNLSRFVYVLKQKASTQTDSATVPGSAPAAITSEEIKRDDSHPQLETGKCAEIPVLSLKSEVQSPDSRPEQGSQKSLDFQRLEIGGSSESAAWNTELEKGLKANVSREPQSGVHSYILERKDENDVIETSESVAPPSISLTLQMLNYASYLGNKIAHLNISVLPLPDSKKEDVKEIFAGLHRCLEALKLATVLKTVCGEYDVNLSHFLDALYNIVEEM